MKTVFVINEFASDIISEKSVSDLSVKEIEKLLEECLKVHPIKENSFSFLLWGEAELTHDKVNIKVIRIKDTKLDELEIT